MRAGRAVLLIPCAPYKQGQMQPVFLKALPQPSLEVLDSWHEATATTLEGRPGTSGPSRGLFEHGAKNPFQHPFGNVSSSPHLAPSAPGGAGETADGGR